MRRNPAREPDSRPPRIINQPRPGFFKLRLVKGGPWVPSRIYAYRPRVAGTDHLAAHVNGEHCEVDRVWLYGHPISEDEYRRMLSSPHAQPKRAVNLAAAAPLF